MAVSFPTYDQKCDLYHKLTLFRFLNIHYAFKIYVIMKSNALLNVLTITSYVVFYSA